MLSLLSDAFFFFFTGFPLSGIYNIPAEVEGHIFTSLSYQSYFKQGAVLFPFWKFFVQAIYKALTSHGMQDLSNFQFTATESSMDKEGAQLSYPDSSWRIQPPLPTDSKAPDRQRENQEVVEAANQSGKRTKTKNVCYTPEVVLLGHTESLASADMGCELLTISSNCLDGIDGRMNKYTH